MQEKKTSAVPIKLTDEHRRILDELRAALGLANASVIRLALRKLHKQEIGQK